MASSPKVRGLIREKVRSYRERMRARGLRPIQIWVPDTRKKGFAAEAHRQALAVARSKGDAREQRFIDSISVLNDE